MGVGVAVGCGVSPGANVAVGVGVAAGRVAVGVAVASPAQAASKNTVIIPMIDNNLALVIIPPWVGRLVRQSCS